MPSRRQEKVARVVQRAVSVAIQEDLSDPRIKGIVSVTRVEVSPDLRSADVYLSVLAGTPGAERCTYQAIVHGRRHLQARVARDVTGKFCPVVHLHRDERFKKTVALMNLIDQASGAVDRLAAAEEVEAAGPDAAPEGTHEGQ